jgi:hypothetical protein
MHHDRSYQPVIIIGAARSGTNMLRDVLTQLPGFGTWPCDEINYIWRHGNVREPTDELGPEHATPSVCAFIRQKFDHYAYQHSLSYIVEKTCANSLRVEFVNQILPEAKFIHIIRDGRDVVASARKRWRASLDLSYIARKARYVPIGDLPYYASCYLANRLYRLVSKERRLSTWGPRFAGIDDALQRRSLEEVCGLQWQRSVLNTESAFEKIDAARIYRLYYEAFVTQPAGELRQLGTFVGTYISPEQAKTMVQGVSAGSIGSWQTTLDQQTVEAISVLINKTLKQYGYKTIFQ